MCTRFIKRFMELSYLWLLASIVLIILGPIVCYLAKNHKLVMILIDSLVVVFIGYMVVFEIFPECFEVIGWMTLVAIIVGLLFPLLVEFFAEKCTRYTHAIIIILITIAMGIHSSLDGVSLSVFAKKGSHSIPLLVILHRFPVGLFIWRLFDRHHAYAALAIAYLIVTCLIGFFSGDYIPIHDHGVLLTYFEAFIAGSILHVVVHRLHCHFHIHH